MHFSDLVVRKAYHYYKYMLPTELLQDFPRSRQHYKGKGILLSLFNLKYLNAPLNKNVIYASVTFFEMSPALTEALKSSQ